MCNSNGLAFISYYQTKMKSQADMNGKKTFIGYMDRIDYTEEMSLEEIWTLFKAILDYQNWKEIWELGNLKFVWSKIKKEMDTDNDKRNEIVEKRRQAWKKWGENKAKNWNNSKIANASNSKQEMADSVSDSVSELKEKEISKDISKKKDEFETFWNEYPHARKWKKKDSMNYFLKQDTDAVMKQVWILKRTIEAWLQDAEYVPACERRIRDFTPLSEEVVKQKLIKICKRHLNAWGDMKQRSLELKQTFWEEQINEIVKAIQQKDSPKNLFLKQNQ